MGGKLRASNPADCLTTFRAAAVTAAFKAAASKSRLPAKRDFKSRPPTALPKLWISSPGGVPAFEAGLPDGFQGRLPPLAKRIQVSDLEAGLQLSELPLADGSVFSGRQAVANKLIDALGGEDEAVAWLGTKGVDAKLRVVEWKSTRRGSFFLPDSLAGLAAQALGLPQGNGDLLRELGADRLFLDGLVSVWHP